MSLCRLKGGPYFHQVHTTKKHNFGVTEATSASKALPHTAHTGLKNVQKASDIEYLKPAKMIHFVGTLSTCAC